MNDPLKKRIGRYPIRHPRAFAGMTLLELIITLALSAVVVLGVASLFSSSQKGSESITRSARNVEAHLALTGIGVPVQQAVEVTIPAPPPSGPTSEINARLFTVGTGPTFRYWLDGNELKFEGYDVISNPPNTVNPPGKTVLRGVASFQVERPRANLLKITITLLDGARASTVVNMRAITSG